MTRAIFRNLSTGSLLSSFVGHPFLVYRITLDRTGSFDDSFRIELASVEMTWRLNV